MATIQEQQKLVKKVQKAFRSRPLESIRKVQATLSIKGPVRDKLWISQDEIKAPQDSNLRDAVYQVIEANTSVEMLIPPRDSVTLSDVAFEWIGQRKGAKLEEEHTRLPDEDIYQKLCADVEHPMTILYCHGGAFYAGSPTYSRPATTKLAKLTKARIASVAYRLAPQNPFPAAVLDLLTAWLSLLYPAEDARHAAVSPDSVVLAGDSAGGNLCLAVVQTILQMQGLSTGAQIRFNGRNVQIPLPAGVAVLSPFGDLSLSLPSWHANADTDFLNDIQAALTPGQPADDIWPCKPPRGDLYCDPSAWPSPLVSVAVADSWRGAPPLWIAVGEERCADSAKLVAARAAQQGVPVEFSEYLGLPHIFPMLLGPLPQAQRCYWDWARACLGFYQEGTRPRSGSATIIHMPGDQTEDVDVTVVTALTVAEAKVLMEASARKRKPWTGPNAAKL